MPFDFTQDPYVRLRDVVSQRTSPVIAWVGAGLSVPASMPSWNMLREMLLEELRKKIATFPSGDDQHSLQKRFYAAQKETNPWTAFGMLKEGLGQTSYREAIRYAFRNSGSAHPPEAYRAIWDLRVRGMINLNIDRLATKAFVSQSTMMPSEFTGGEATRLGSLLKEPQQFIINLHGIIDNHQTWVFTDSELGKLRETESYHTFIQATLCSHTVVFLGLTVEDVAVGGHLQALAAQGIDSGPHYWITARTDQATDEWAERLGVRVIRYTAEGHNHSEMLAALQDLRTFVPPEDSPITVPVISATVSGEDSPLPAPGALAKLDAEDIRFALNAYVNNLKKDGSIDAGKFAEFRKDYDEAIYRSWYVSDKPGKNQFLGYTIQNSVKKGAFGSVFKALDHQGNERAIKLLLEEIRDDSDLTQSFRRGVSSMQILGTRGVDGIVSYVDSSEIPAFVVMDWVDGPSLEEAVVSIQLIDWVIILRCAFELSTILRRAHELPERVLHRDLRPANVMLEGFYTKDKWRVVVLDFDLSWHKDASDRSVVYGATVLGYLAPEQIERTKGVSTRHAGVDVFGLGMLLYFLVSRRHPLPSEHRHRDWPNTAKVAATSVKQSGWRSIGTRYERVILASTQHQQSARWDLAQVQVELGRLSEAAQRPESVVSMDLIAEEIAHRADSMRGYAWNDDQNAAKVNLPTGIGITIVGDISDDRLEMVITWQNTGVHQYQNVGKWLTPAARNAEAVLRKAGWNTSATFDIQALRIDASLEHKDIGELDNVSTSIEAALQQLRRVG